MRNSKVILSRMFNSKRKRPKSPYDPSGLDRTVETSGDSTASNLRLRPGTEYSGPSPESSLPNSFHDGVEVLHDCPNAIVDICFIHGLTGNRDSTWTADGQCTPWPKTFLPSKLTRARIVTYGYDAYIVRKSVASSNRLIDHALNLLNDLTTDRASYNASSRPLIFVTHSLGGLICKEAILLSRNNPESHLRDIFNCIKGIIFMGTPHKGSWMAEWAKIPASALGLIKSTNKSLLKTLETDGQFLESIQVRFWSMIRELREAGRRLEITCFFEELPLPMVGLVVSKESATLEGYSSMSIHANHSNMVKFGSAKDTGFERLLGELVRWESQINDSAASQPTRPKEALQVSKVASSSFHEHDPELQFDAPWRYERSHPSAILPGHMAIRTHRNRMDMTRFDAEDDPIYMVDETLIRDKRRQEKVSLHFPIEDAQNSQMEAFPHRESALSFRGLDHQIPQARYSMDSRDDSFRSRDRRRALFKDDNEARHSYTPLPRQSGNFTGPSLPYRNFNAEYKNVSQFKSRRQELGVRENSPEGSVRKNGVKLPFGREDGLDEAPLFQNAIFDIPLPRNPHFTGQETLLRTLENELEEYIRSDYTSLHRLILTGMGGIGKTELAIQFSSRHRTKFYGVFWADAATRSSLESSFYRSYRGIERINSKRKSRYSALSASRVSQVNLHTPTQYFGYDSPFNYDSPSFLHWLGRTRSPWLLVVDNMDNPDMVETLESILSHLHSGFIVVTTRNRKVARLGIPIEVSGMDPGACVELLLRSTNRWKTPAEAEIRLATQLVEKIGCLPLAVDQAAAYINFCDLSIHEYLAIFESDADYLLNLSAENRYSNTKAEYSDGKYDTVLKTWELSFSIVLKRDPGAACLLQLFAFLNPEHISEALFASFTFPPLDQWSDSGELSKFDSATIHAPLPLVNCLRDRNKFMAAYGTLLRFSLIKRRANAGDNRKGFWIHPLVHYWASARMRDTEKLQWLRTTAAFLSVSIPLRLQRPAFEQTALSTNVLSHVQQLFESSFTIELSPPIGVLPHIFYNMPFSNDNVISHRTCEQLYHISGIAGDQFLFLSTRLWELADACQRKPICQNETLRVISDTVQAVKVLRQELQGHKSEEINALLFQIAFRLGHTFESRVCDAPNSNKPHRPCIVGIIKASLPFIREVIFQWNPVRTKSTYMQDPLGPWGLRTSSREYQAYQLKAIYLFAIMKKRRDEAEPIDSTEQLLQAHLSDFENVKSIYLPILNRLIEFAGLHNRPVKDSIKAVRYLIEKVNGTEDVSKELAHVIAKTFTRMLDGEDTAPRPSLEALENAGRWGIIHYFLEKVSNWEGMVGLPTKATASERISLWVRFMSLFNLSLGLENDPSKYFDKDELRKNWTKEIRKEDAEALFSKCGLSLDNYYRDNIKEVLANPDDLDIRRRIISTVSR